MTKLYCPKGHELDLKLYEMVTVRSDQPTQGGGGYDEQFLNYPMCYCKPCDRPYFETDYLNEPLANDTNVVTKDSNSAEIDGIKTESQIAVDRVVEALDWTVKNISVDTSSLGSLRILKAKLKELNK